MVSEILPDMELTIGGDYDQMLVHVVLVDARQVLQVLSQLWHNLLTRIGTEHTKCIYMQRSKKYCRISLDSSRTKV